MGMGDFAIRIFLVLMQNRFSNGATNTCWRGNFGLETVRPLRTVHARQQHPQRVRSWRLEIVTMDYFAMRISLVFEPNRFWGGEIVYAVKGD